MRHGSQVLHVALVLPIILAGGLVGCTVKQIKPEVLVPSAQKYSAVAIGDIGTEDKLWEYLVPHFRRGLIQRLSEKQAFEAIFDPAPPQMAETAVLFTGKFTNIDKGNAALRWIVGFGAGKAQVEGVFELRDPRGGTLAKLAASESYLGGAGIGGAGYLDMEDLMRRFGETMGDRIIQWSRGEKIE